MAWMDVFPLEGNPYQMLPIKEIPVSTNRVFSRPTVMVVAMETVGQTNKRSVTAGVQASSGPLHKASRI